MATGFGKRGLDVKPLVKGVVLSHEQLNVKQLRRARVFCGLVLLVTIVAVGATAVFSFATPEATTSAQEQSLPIRDDWTVVSTKKVAFKRPGEPTATYTVFGVARTGDGKAVAMNTRYSDAAGTDYVVRVYDCEAAKLFTVGSGVTFEAMQVYRPDTRWSELVEGSSATRVAAIACTSIGKQLATTRG